MTDSNTPASEVAALQPSPKGLGVLKAAFRERRTLAMLLLLWRLAWHLRALAARLRRALSGAASDPVSPP